jgi:hypothetical protein
MLAREVRGEAVPGQFPALVSQAQPLHAGHRTEGTGDEGIDSLDRRLVALRHAVMIRQGSRRECTETVQATLLGPRSHLAEVDEVLRLEHALEQEQ